MSTFADGLIAIIILAVVCIALVFVGVMADAVLGSNSTFTRFQPQFNQTFGIIAGAIPLLLMALGLGAIISAFLIRTHPIFVVPSILLLGVQMLITPMLTNIWSAIITGNSTVTAKALTFTSMVFIMDNLPLITLVMAALAIFVSFMRGSDQ